MTIVCLSDTHELHRELDVPNGDLLIHAGDITMFSKSTAAIRDFNDWLGELPHRYKIVVPGNHEFFLEADPTKRSLLSNATVLVDESVEVMGLKIWGSPVTPLYGGAYGLSSAADRTALYSNVPDDVDIMVTHGPPYGILDRSPGESAHQGCRQLLEVVRRIVPKLHVFGHIHGAYGTQNHLNTLFVNAALLGPDGDLAAHPLSFALPQV